MDFSPNRPIRGQEASNKRVGEVMLSNDNGYHYMDVKNLQ